MAIVGHWSSLAEAGKLATSVLLAGIVQEVYEEGSLLPMLPVTAITGKSILYNREKTLPSGAFFDIHQQIPWTADVDYAAQVEVALKRVARQDILDNFIMDTYNNVNDYKSIVLSQLRKGVMRTIEQKILFGSISSDPAEFDGIGKLFSADAADGDVFSSTSQQHDQGGSSSVMTMAGLRVLIDRVKPRPDLLITSRTFRNTLSATAFEKGIASTIPIGGITYDKNEFGRRVDFFDGVPILVSDYAVDLVDNTAVADDGDDSGINQIIAVRFGQIGDGGLSLLIGGNTGGPEFFMMKELEALEDYDAGGIRLTAYCALALGSTKALARVHSMDEDGTIAA